MEIFQQEIAEKKIATTWSNFWLLKFEMVAKSFKINLANSLPFYWMTPECKCQRFEINPSSIDHKRNLPVSKASNSFFLPWPFIWEGPPFIPVSFFSSKRGKTEELLSKGNSTSLPPFPWPEAGAEREGKKFRPPLLLAENRGTKKVLHYRLMCRARFFSRRKHESIHPFAG